MMGGVQARGLRKRVGCGETATRTTSQREGLGQTISNMRKKSKGDHVLGPSQRAQPLSLLEEHFAAEEAKKRKESMQGGVVRVRV